MKKLLLAFSLFFIFSCSKGKREFIKTGKLPNFQLVNQTNETITNWDVANKVIVVEFFFTTCPTICKVMNKNMLQIQKEFFGRSNFEILSITVDPKNDTPEVLLNYANKLGASTNNWQFLTGDKDTIYNLALNGFFVNAQEDEIAPGGFLHTSIFILIDFEGNIISRIDENKNPTLYDGTSPSDIKKLKSDIHYILKNKVI